MGGCARSRGGGIFSSASVGRDFCAWLLVFDTGRGVFLLCCLGLDGVRGVAEARFWRGRDGVYSQSADVMTVCKVGAAWVRGPRAVCVTISCAECTIATAVVAMCACCVDVMCCISP